MTHFVFVGGRVWLVHVVARGSEHVVQQVLSIHVPGRRICRCPLLRKSQKHFRLFPNILYLFISIQNYYQWYSEKMALFTYCIEGPLNYT